MELNHDCVRHTLLYLEQELAYGNYVQMNGVTIKDFSPEEIIYSVDKLLEAEYLTGEKYISPGETLPIIVIASITWQGHQFLDNIRDDGVWKDTKKIISKFSSVSLSLTSSVAAQLITAFIKSQLGLP